MRNWCAVSPGTRSCANRAGGAILERWRNEWKPSFDLVLIDSRTGITDTGGICTILLPDFLVLVFTANDQSFEGTLAIAASAQAERRTLAVQRPPLMFLPLLSRFDRRDEIAEADKWLARFAEGLIPLYADWLPTQFKPAQILEVTKIPYVTRFSFGEPLPVLTHSLTDPELPGYYLERCARLLDSDFSEAARILKGDSDESQGDGGLAITVHQGPRQAIGVYERALTNARRIGDSQGEADALVNLGNTYWALGEPQQAVTYYEESLRLHRQSGDRVSEGNVFGKLGLAYTAMGRFNEAIGYYEQQLVIIREIGDQRGEGNALGNLGVAYSNLGAVEKSVGYYEQALAIAREIVDRRGEGTGLGNLGNAYADLGEAEKAIEYYEQTLAIHREIGDRRGEGAALGNLGLAYADRGEIEKAVGYYEQQLVIAGETGDRRGEGNALGNLGNAYAELGEVERAIGYLDQRLTIAREIGDRRGESAALANLGVAYKDLGETEKAAALLQQSKSIGKQIRDPRIVHVATEVLAEIQSPAG
jgi:tetratricopeptide (TPR) repeat protein